MNVFFVDDDPVVAAQSLHDKHVVKMILETAQILSTVCDRWGVWKPELYRPTHPRHPSVLWAGDGIYNFRWLAEHGKALLEEYSYRYSGRVHASLDVLYRAAGIGETAGMPPIWSEPPQAMPDEFKVPGNSIIAYRRYYLGRKVEQSKWTRRPAPTWIEEGTAIMARKKKEGATPEMEAQAAAEVTQATEASTEAATATRAANTPRGLRGVSPDAKITVLIDHNPKRPGCAAEKRFALYRTGMTQKEFLDAGGTSPDMAYDSAHGFISIEGYDPKAVVKKERAPKAEKPAKEPKPRKTRRAEAPAPEANPVDAEVVEETID